MMDQIHNPAQRVTERYLLGELNEEERLQFEEHYFTCEQCAEDVLAGAAFVDTARLVLPDMQREAARQPAGPTSFFAKWCSWSLVPQFSMAALLLLTGVVVYQNFVQIPHLRSTETPVATVFPQQNSPLGFSFGDIVVSNRSAGGEKISRKARTYSFSFKPEWQETYQQYLCELQKSGNAVATIPIPYSSGVPTAELKLDNLEKGQYVIRLYGISHGSLKKPLVQQPFTLED